MTIVDTLLLGVQGLIGFLFLGTGGAKLVAVEDRVAEFDRYGFPQWFRVVIGIIEVGGGLGLLIGIILTPMYAILGGLVLSGTMAGAVLTHLVQVNDPVSEAVPAGLLLIGVAIVTAYHLLAVP